MKHLKLFDSYISAEERNINDILDRMNNGDQSSDDEISDLKDYDKNNEPTGYVDDDEREYMDTAKKEYNIHFKHLAGKEISPDDLKDAIRKMKNKEFSIHPFMTFYNEHPEIFDNLELRDIWKVFMLNPEW